MVLGGVTHVAEGVVGGGRKPIANDENLTYLHTSCVACSKLQKLVPCTASRVRLHVHVFIATLLAVCVQAPVLHAG